MGEKVSQFKFRKATSILVILRLLWSSIRQLMAVVMYDRSKTMHSTLIDGRGYRIAMLLYLGAMLGDSTESIRNTIRI